MAKTRTQFITYVTQDFKRDDKDTEIVQAYNDTIQHLSNLEGIVGLKFQSWIPTVVEQEDYPLPSTRCHVFHPIRWIKSATSSVGYPMNKLSKEEFSKKYPNPNATDVSALTKSRPEDYTVFSNSILVGPLPDLATYILELDWAKLRTSQDAASDVQELGEEWEEVIKFGVLARLYEGIGLTGEADRYWLLYKDDELGYPTLLRKNEDQEQTIEAVNPNPGF